MVWYIVYPSHHNGMVHVYNFKPERTWSDGAYKNISEVKKQLTRMNIPLNQRPIKFR